MGLIDKIKSVFVAPIVKEKEEGAAMVQSMKEAGAAVLAHLGALCSLLKLELEEAAERLGKKILFLLLAVLTGLFGYLFLWGLLTMIMAHYWGIIIGLAVTTGLHLVAACISLIIFSRIRVAPLAPATMEEIQTDLSCLQLALKKNTNS